ncbi:MAG: hypothetical protein N2322_00135, partial [Terrimicrobiaceae bacterium]|nr:hypothetical protein [Terrimicrobiaceae bacterium]
MKKLRAGTTLGSLAAAGAAVALIFLVAEISLLVAGRISRQAVLEDLAEASRRNAVLFARRLAMALGDMALLNNAAEGRGQASRESIQRAMRSLHALRGTYAGAALFDRRGSEVFSTGAVPRSLAGGGEAASRWMALLRELPENEVLAFPERLAAAPVLVLAMRVGGAQSGDVAVFVAPAEKLLSDAPLPPDEHFLILRTESGDQYELDASGRIMPAASIPVPPSGGQTRGEASESAEFLAAWNGLLIEPDPSLPQESLHFSGKSHTGWSLAAVRSTASLRQQMAGIEAGIRILASVLALITAPLAFVATAAYLRLSELRRQLNQILEASPVGILAVRAEENSENLRLELANPAAAAILTP